MQINSNPASTRMNRAAGLLASAQPARPINNPALA
jgi:hypothetical protein